MGYVARFKKGGKTLDISTGIYTLSDWIPPRANIISNIASGTSANRYGGGVKVSERAVNTSTVFSVRIQGGSNAECEAGARRIENFLRQSGDEAEPMYLEWRPDNNVGFEPLYGQFGANIRYEVVSGQIDRWNAYFIAETRNSIMFVNVMLELKPFATGKRQQLATATGGIFEEVAGSQDGVSRGVSIPNAGGNKMTNPVFGHSTWDNDWNDGSDIVSEQNTDPEYVLFGDSSAKLSRTGSGSTFDQSINAGTTTTHVLGYFVKRQDGSAVTASDSQIVYGTAATDPTIIRGIGNGWYRASGTFAGIGSAVAAGVKVLANGMPIYVDGFSLEELSIPSPFFYGDMLGCGWSGTAHASTSTRTAGSLKVTNSGNLNNGQGTVRIIWKTEYSSSNLTATTYLCYATNGMHIRYNGSTNVWLWHDGTNAITSSTDTFSRNAIIILHAVYSGSGLKLYKDGVEIATGNTYTAADQGASMFIGTDNAGSNHCFGTFLGFTTFAEAMTAAEVAADAANIEELIDSGDGLGVAIDPIPWLWTKDGDNTIGNSDDATYNNWGIVGGINGNVPAEMEMTLVDGNQYVYYYISRLDMPYDNYYTPGSLTYNGPGTVSVGTAAASLGYVSLPQPLVDSLQGKGVATIVRGRTPTTNNLLMSTGIYVDSNVHYSDYNTVSFVVHASDNSIDSTPANSLPAITERYRETNISPSTRVYAYAKRSSGTAENFFVTSIQAIPRPYIKVGDSALSQYGLAYFDDIYRARSLLGDISYNLPAIGDRVDLMPFKYNALIFNGGAEGAASDPTDGITITLYNVPRWSLA